MKHVSIARLDQTPEPAAAAGRGSSQTLGGKQSVKILLLLGLGTALLQVGCMSTIALVNAADGAVTRSPKPQAGVYSMSFIYEDSKPIVMAFKCEEYYDTQASTRGNSWAWREQRVVDRSASREIVVEDQRFGLIKFKVPTCHELNDPFSSTVPFSMIVVGGKYYIHVRSDGGMHLYRPHGAGVGEGQSISLRFTYRIIYLAQAPNQTPEPTAAAGRG